MGNIVCFGEILIDLLAQPPASPEQPRAFLQYAGGAPANVAVAAARLGVGTQFVGMLGRDMFGDFLADSLQQHGVGTDFIARTDAAKTALAFVALDAHGERSFSFYRPPAADLLFRAADFQAGCFDQASCFHVCSNSLTEAEIARTTFEGMQRARASGALVSLDLNLRPALWPTDADPLPTLWQALELADVVKLSREELDYLAAPLGPQGAEQVLQRLLGAHARWVVVTDGAAPLQWHARDSSGQVESFSVPTVDSTAAGDAFVGGLLTALVERGVDAAGLPAFCADPTAMRAVLRFGAAVGALAVTRKGAFAAMPSRAEVDALLQQPEETP
ncbi:MULTISPECIES: carbohydrate kinase [unclassified Stenotrophomonas]|uniref:carbohydrate kinase family protein n=1 Tax=unclassified Stenotrophomonas TaxID=196198 RepID=UPI00177BE047|nr:MULTISPECIES: carbohydrate kinase [unclassified Stenotrophomonas]MBD8634285.1 carbohydrate kinase [Stenotrophomonas sp. CFBP 13725]MBD8694824.1 carbohydrate kinase [Stenotrophomonas sp. CFBP 13718]